MEHMKDIEMISAKLDKALENHNKWRSNSLNLVASESILWDTTDQLNYKDLTRRAILGIPGQRYSEGGQYIDDIEKITEELLKDAFTAIHAEWRPISGSMADGILIHALTSVGDKIIATPTPLGHPTWHEKGYSGFRGLSITDIPYDWESLEPDYAKLSELTSKQTFRLLIDGSSLILFPPDFTKLMRSANGSPIWYDGAHVLGLIMGGKFPNPLDFGILALSGSAQKTMAGPLGGVILTNDDDIYSRIVDVTSNDMATPDYSRYVMLSKTLLNWKKAGREFAQRITGNAKSLSEELVNAGLRVILEERGYTATHQIGLVAPNSMNAETAAQKLAKSSIITTPFPLPKRMKDREILRLGVTEITQMGFDKDDMEIVAMAIKQAFTDAQGTSNKIKEIMEEKAKVQV